MPSWIGRVPVIILVADFCLLLYFFSGITDVNWANPVSAPLVFAVLLAAMVTVVFYGFVSFTGYRLRIFKNHCRHGLRDGSRRSHPDGLRVTIVGVVVVASLMFIRMRTEVLGALGSQAWASALVIALALAVVSAMANFLVVVIHALDGSDELARLHALSSAATARSPRPTTCVSTPPRSRLVSRFTVATRTGSRHGPSPGPASSCRPPIRSSTPHGPSTREHGPHTARSAIRISTMVSRVT